MMRYNTTLNVVEIYNGATSTWNTVAASAYTVDVLIAAGGGGGEAVGEVAVEGCPLPCQTGLLCRCPHQPQCRMSVVVDELPRPDYSGCSDWRAHMYFLARRGCMVAHHSCGRRHTPPFLVPCRGFGHKGCLHSQVGAMFQAPGQGGSVLQAPGGSVFQAPALGGVAAVDARGRQARQARAAAGRGHLTEAGACATR